MWREAVERALEPPLLRTLQAAFARELSPAKRASARRGGALRKPRVAAWVERFTGGVLVAFALRLALQRH